MTRKRTTENDLLVTPGAPATPARRKTTARTRSKRTALPAETIAAPAVAPDSVTPEAAVAAAVVEPSREEIACLAYLYWEARGCQGGSPEEDWLRAEQELRTRAAVAVA